MTMYARLLAAALLCISMTACSVDQEAAGHYKQESPIQIDIAVPEPIVLNAPLTITAALNQNGSPVEAAEYVDFTVWEKNGSPKEKITGKNAGRGVYSAQYTITKNGTYYVKVHASANGSTIMPTKQFIVGEITEEIPVPKQEKAQDHQHH